MKGEGQGSYKSWAEMLLLCRQGYTDLTFPAGHKLATVFWTTVKSQLLHTEIFAVLQTALWWYYYPHFTMIKKKKIKAQRSEAIT